MYELVPEGDSNIATFKATGILSDSDYDTLAEEMDIFLGKHNVARVLVDWEQLEGWEQGARTASSWFGRVHSNLIERMAIVADNKWKDETLRIADIVKLTDVRIFVPSERDAAWAWLNEGRRG